MPEQYVEWHREWAGTRAMHTMTPEWAGARVRTLTLEWAGASYW
jgi:hypothetical protein